MERSSMWRACASKRAFRIGVLCAILTPVAKVMAKRLKHTQNDPNKEHVTINSRLCADLPTHGISAPSTCNLTAQHHLSQIPLHQPHSDSVSIIISSSSCSASVVPLSFSPVHQAAGSSPNCLLHRLESGGILSLAGWSNDGERLRFVDTEGNEWSNVENRFDQLAYTTYGVNGAQRVVKWSDFGSCIGMRESAEFSNELLRALRGRRREWKRDITKDELRHFWTRMTDPWLDSRIQLLFDLCDRNMDGRIHERDIKQVISLICPINKLSIKHKEAEEYAALIMEALDIEHQGYIQPSDLEALFKAHLPKGSSTISYQKNRRHHHQKQVSLSKAEILFRSYWRRAWIILLWLMICFTLFTWKFIQYSHRSAFQVMGYCLSTAKGAAETLKLNMALILLPVCRNTITWLRKNPGFNSVIPFNDNINFHKPAGFGYQQPSYLQILATTEVATGITMVILMMIAFTLATNWPRRRSPALPRSIRKFTGYNTFGELISGEGVVSKTAKTTGFRHKSGMYIFIQCPQVSPFEWHPFSLTCGPEDDYLSVHIRTLGDWSYQLYGLFREVNITIRIRMTKAAPKNLYDGPYGASSQDHIKYDIVVMVGLGIGITPFISILKDIATRLNNSTINHAACGEGSLEKTPFKAYLYWVTREQSSFNWFMDVMKEIAEANEKQVRISSHSSSII
ncbi:Respiratory burst oxidase [Hibiscus syriacus]|uniref:Respiratory burst oxidase n=1 Tax=Hibiscus syriacus TaxID=106335 RepID=A0A6A2YXK1_HIBSY|nr:Respiratory burst oxidase [Hibiscus syriacus]